MSKTKLNLITLNCQGLRDQAKRACLFQWLNCFRPSIVCLQETHSRSHAEFVRWLRDLTHAGQNQAGYKVVSSPGAVRSRGVAILYLPHAQVKLSRHDPDGRFVLALCLVAEFSFQLLNIYAPNARLDNIAFIESLYPYVDPVVPVFLCGDFNSAVDPAIDRLGGNPSSYWSNNWSAPHHLFVQTYQLRDAWRETHPLVRDYTWERADGSVKSRLDMWWIPSNLLRSVSAEILPFFRSDHKYVSLTLSLDAVRGKGIWKCNNSHLSDADFRERVSSFWQQWKLRETDFCLQSAWWDAGKVRLKRIAMQFAHEKSSRTKQRIASFDCTVIHLQARINRGEPVRSLLAEAKAELADELLAKAKGAQLRSRVRWAEEGENATSFFLQQEKVRGRARLITAMRNEQGDTVSSASAISHVWTSYYQRLFSAEPLDHIEQQHFIDRLERSLSPTQSLSCEGDLTEDECYAALKAMPRNKTPGIDGLSAEFLLAFWTELGSDLVRTMNSSFQRGKLSASQRSGVITLLYKKDDALLTKNWRPITLLCVDYKVMAKALANRLLQVISHVVSPDQTCGVPGRFAGENVRVLKDITAFANANDWPVMVLSLDQEKAFDRVDWSYLQNVLVAMGFGSSFCRWILLLYTGINSAVLVNGNLSQAFPVSRGVRQGCPVSPLLYTLVAESLACAIRADHRIDGFPLPLSDNKIKLVQYADDTSPVVRSVASLHALLDLFARYERASGAKLNLGKCHGLLVGAFRAIPEPPVPLQWSRSHIVVLGSRIGNDGQEDWSGPLAQLEHVLSSWSSRQLSMHGRALVANMLGFSLLWYLATISIMPDAVIAQVNRLIFRFVWSRKREWLARSSLTQSRANGGLGVVCLITKLTALRAMWVKRFLVGERKGWHSFFECVLESAFMLNINNRAFNMRCIGRDGVDNLPPFYREAMLAWYHLDGHQVNGRWVIPKPDGSFLPLEELSTRHAYQLAYSPVEHKCVQKYRDNGILVASWPQVWQSLHLWHFFAFRKEYVLVGRPRFNFDRRSPHSWGSSWC